MTNWGCMVGRYHPEGIGFAVRFYVAKVKDIEKGVG